jgi:cysteinyl-tRNA synthetase
VLRGRLGDAAAIRCPAVAVRLYSTLSRRKEDLAPPPGPIGIYYCGPTVYQRIHVGNAYAVSVVPLWLKRWLELRGYEVTLVVNITDVNDKIYEAAPGASAQLAEDATRWYFEDTDGLHLGRPDFEPKATETIPEIIGLIEELVGRGLAYEADGDVYFRVARFPEYGRLSGQRPDQVEEQEPNPRKEDPRDFALWKANKPGEDTWWDSPWGRGRPGWHIECSAMAEKYVGPSFEIHGGGLDLVFPHHEDEIAQSRGAGREFARLWMHNGILRFSGEEMHKSIGNVVTLRDALDRWGRDTLLVFFLTGHWRKPLDFSEATLAAAEARAERLRDVFRAPSEPAHDGAWDRFAAALDDDFNTPEALAVMHEWKDHELLVRALDVFGLATLAEQREAPAEVRELAERRRDARARGDYHAGDRLRDEIEAAGWEVRDVADGYQLVPR